MLIADNYSKTDQQMRRYYVGITRAKNRLFIHTNGNSFKQQSTDQYLIDQRQYALPEEIVLQLSLKDVYLDFFKGLKREILSLRSGEALKYKDCVLFNSQNKAVAKLSANMQKTVSDWKEKGYEVKAASVHFIVAWKPKEATKDERETAVLLADLVLCRIQNT